jgi:protein AATF/BFR2
MQTPVGQAKKILSNWDRVKSKCQQKRGTFRILFQDEENVRNSTDPQIFDDFELFAELEKGFINDIQDDSDFRINDTLRYLRNRENKTEKNQEVDRKASKNRKLRFNAHPKLLNFMPSYPASLIEARDEIVENFFNCRAGSAVQDKRQEDGETFYIDL